MSCTDDIFGRVQYTYAYRHISCRVIREQLTNMGNRLDECLGRVCLQIINTVVESYKWYLNLKMLRNITEITCIHILHRRSIPTVNFLHKAIDRFNQ